MPDQPSSARLAIDQDSLREFCRRRHVNRLAFFGSVLRDDFGPDSDVDVLIEFAPGHVPGLDIYDVEQELSQICGGRVVDLVNPRYLNPRIRDEVLTTAQVAYEGSRISVT
jgi:predicted nucleotidyltransferase